MNYPCFCLDSWSVMLVLIVATYSAPDSAVNDRILLANLRRIYPFPYLTRLFHLNMMSEGWAPPGCTLPKTHHAMTTYNHTIPDRSPPGSTRTAPSAGHQDGGVKCATGASSKIRGRDNITFGTWNTRTLRAAGKLQELTHEMNMYGFVRSCLHRVTAFV